MKPTRLSGLLAAALAVGSISALHAAGQFSGLPVVGGAAVCALYAGDGTTCQGYVPAGPVAVTGLELIPADTALPNGQSPQSVLIPSGMLGGNGQGGFRNLLVGGDFYTNPWQRGTTPASAATPTTAAMTADRWFVYSSGNTATIAKKTSGADISASAGILASLQVNRPSGTDVTPICVGQVLPASETQNLLGKNAVLSWHGLNGAGMSSANGAVTATIAYATAADSATPGTNTDAFAKATLTGYTVAVATVVPQSTTWTRYQTYAAIPSTATTVGVKFCYTPVGTGGATDNFDLARVQLEATNQVSAGSFAHRPPELELALSQYYSYSLVEKTNVVYAGGVLCSASGSALIALQFPVQMRGTPTLTVTAGGYSIQTAVAVTAIGTTTLSVASPQHATLTSAAACTSTLPYQLKGTNTTGSFVFSAEP